MSRLPLHSLSIERGCSSRNNKNTKEYQPVSMEFDGSASQEAGGLRPHDDSSKSTFQRLVACFWILGLLNNSSYVIMIACAKSISEGGTALVFLANVVPSLAVKGSAAFWFDKVAYRTRLQVAAIFMATSFVIVAVTSGAAVSSKTAVSTSTPLNDPPRDTLWSYTLIMQLVGVACASLQCGLGEASLLALAGKMDSAAFHPTETPDHDVPATSRNDGRCLTSFSSGTGMAGIFGFFWKWLWNDALDLSMSTTLWLALSLAVGYWYSFQYAQQQQASLERMATLTAPATTTDACISDNTEKFSVPEEETMSHETQALAPPTSFGTVPTGTITVTPISEMTAAQRFQLVLNLWPYMIPLFAVYAAEYALQAGTWTAIGFPVESMEARDRFFENSNWIYQVGVFISRSSGTLFTVPMTVLWLMPALQVVNLVFYTYIASHPTRSALYRKSVLYAGALYTGLLGGGTYIHGYRRICFDVPVEHRELSLAATSVAEGVGIVVADAIGLIIQSCLYQVNHLDGALASCPSMFTK